MMINVVEQNFKQQVMVNMWGFDFYSLDTPVLKAKQDKKIGCVVEMKKERHVMN